MVMRFLGYMHCFGDDKRWAFSFHGLFSCVLYFLHFNWSDSLIITLFILPEEHNIIVLRHVGVIVKNCDSDILFVVAAAL